MACFLLPLAAAWVLVDYWRPGGSVQHGELLNPARPVDLQFSAPAHKALANTGIRGKWVLVYVGSSAVCDTHCHTSLYAMRQVRLALGKDIERLNTLLLLDNEPVAEFQQWLTAEHPAMRIGIVGGDQRGTIINAFPQPGQVGDWIYLVDPLGNLLMRYPVDVDPRGILKDLQRLLRWSKIG